MRKKTTVVWGNVKERPTTEDLIEFLKNAIEFSGKTEKELCKLSNISPRTLGRWLTEPKRPSNLKMMKFIATCYGKENFDKAADDLMELLDRVNEKSRAASPTRYQQLMDHLTSRKKELIERGWRGFKEDE